MTPGQLREQAFEIWNAGVAAVRGEPLVRRAVVAVGDRLQIGEHHWHRADFDRLLVVGTGKATRAMGAGLIAAVNEWLPGDGWINAPQGADRPLPEIHVHAARPAGVNEPTEEGVAGSQQILNLVSNASQRDLCIALISGGGSALLPAPADGITLNDKLQVTRWLSAAGADITELNTVRKRLSKIKGGGLLRACNAGHLITLVLSDVMGDPLDMIASGPTVPDATTRDDALAVLGKYDPDHQLPVNVYETLRNRTAIPTDHASVCPYTTIVIGNNALAVDQAGNKAESFGYNHAMHVSASGEGTAEEVGRRLAELTIEMLRADPDRHRTDCLITGGEPTVKLVSSERRGVGGRNQQLVLAAYQHLLAAGLSEDEWRRFALLAGGTDGEDGPTDAAGAILYGDAHHRAAEIGLDVADHLRRNDAYSFFQACHGLLKTGPTGTNVCDLRVVVVSAA